MLLRSPTLASAYAFYFLIYFYCLQLVIAQPQPPVSASPQNTVSGSEDSQRLTCTPFGACEPCPPEAMHQPFCQPFGNRRLMHCVNSTNVDQSTQPTESPSPPPSHIEGEHPPGEVLAWESCGRIVPQERADFFEFVACNVVFAAVALVVLFFRSRRREAQQARQLAARIGLNWGDGGATTRGPTR